MTSEKCVRNHDFECIDYVGVFYKFMYARLVVLISGGSRWQKFHEAAFDPLMNGPWGAFRGRVVQYGPRCTLRCTAVSFRLRRSMCRGRDHFCTKSDTVGDTTAQHSLGMRTMDDRTIT